MCKKWIKNTILYIRLIEWGAIRQIHFEILNLKPETHFKQVGTNAAMDWESCRLSANRWYHDLETFFYTICQWSFFVVVVVTSELELCARALGSWISWRSLSVSVCLLSVSLPGILLSCTFTLDISKSLKAFCRWR